MELLFVIKDGKVSTSTKGKKTKQWLLEIEKHCMGVFVSKNNAKVIQKSNIESSFVSVFMASC
jgi:hypothetical protein